MSDAQHALFRDWFFHKLDRMQRTTLVSICLPMDLKVAQSLPTVMQFTACDILFSRFAASVGRNAERQDRNGLGPQDEHAVGEAETPESNAND